MLEFGCLLQSLTWRLDLNLHDARPFGFLLIDVHLFLLVGLLLQFLLIALEFLDLTIEIFNLPLQRLVFSPESLQAMTGSIAQLASPSREAARLRLFPMFLLLLHRSLSLFHSSFGLIGGVRSVPLDFCFHLFKLFGIQPFVLFRHFQLLSGHLGLLLRHFSLLLGECLQLLNLFAIE